MQPRGDSDRDAADFRSASIRSNDCETIFLDSHRFELFLDVRLCGGGFAEFGAETPSQAALRRGTCLPLSFFAIARLRLVVTGAREPRSRQERCKSSRRKGEEENESHTNLSYFFSFLSLLVFSHFDWQSRSVWTESASAEFIMENAIIGRERVCVRV